MTVVIVTLRSTWVNIVAWAPGYALVPRISHARLPVVELLLLPRPSRSCHPFGRGRCVRARDATAQQRGIDSVDSAEIIVQRGGRAPAWKVGGAGIGLPGAMFLLAVAIECPWLTAGSRESPRRMAYAWPEAERSGSPFVAVVTRGDESSAPARPAARLRPGSPPSPRRVRTGTGYQKSVQ